jgi:hypothetical protein
MSAQYTIKIIAGGLKGLGARHVRLFRASPPSFFAARAQLPISN